MNAARITPAMLRAGDAKALAFLCQRRGPAVFAYCVCVAGREHAMTAAADAFARFRLAILPPGSLAEAEQAEQLMRSMTRRAALSHAVRAPSLCDGWETELVGNVENTLTQADRERLDAHLSKCFSCAAALQRLEAGERAFESMSAPALTRPVAEAIVTAMAQAAPVGPRAGTELEGRDEPLLLDARDAVAPPAAPVVPAQPSMPPERVAPADGGRRTFTSSATRAPVSRDTITGRGRDRVARPQNENTGRRTRLTAMPGNRLPSDRRGARFHKARAARSPIEARPGSTGGHRDDIQGLRAVAVLLVVLSHAGVSFLAGGFVGVDVFFVLSGFLITGLLISRAASPPVQALVDFYARRARRILPAAALTLLVTDVVAYSALNFVRAKEVVFDSISGVLFTANIHFANRGVDYFAQGQPPSPLQHYWSLAVEEQFYVVWPVVVTLIVFGLGVDRSRRGAHVVSARGIRRLLVLVAVVITASLAWSVYDTAAHPVSAYFSTLTRAWELGLGAALAIGSSSLARFGSRARAAIGWLGLGAIIVASMTFSARTAFPGMSAVLPTMGAGLVIAAGIAAERGRFDVGRLLAVAPLKYVGDRSYSFYLWHWPVLVIAAEYEDRALSQGTKLLLLVAAFALSSVTYRFFEDPIRRSAWRRRSYMLTLWPASVLAVLTIAGYLLHAIDVKSTLLASSAAPPAELLGASPAQPSSPATDVPTATDTPDKVAELPQVTAAVRAAQRGAAVPTALTPPIAQLLHDHYQAPSGCVASAGMTTSSICTLGNTSSATVVAVIGDSHALMWMPALLIAAKRADWQIRLISKSSCTPYDWSHEPIGSECRKWLRWATQQVQRLHPAVALIGGYYSATQLDAAFAAESATGIGTLADRLNKRPVKVVVMGDAPSQNREPVDCLLARRATLATCTTTLTSTQLSLSQQIAATARGHGEGFLDTTGWFCTDLRCPTVIGHTIAYSDKGHVSQTYSRQLGGVFHNALRRVIAATKTSTTAGGTTP